MTFLIIALSVVSVLCVVLVFLYMRMRNKAQFYYESIDSLIYPFYVFTADKKELNIANSAAKSPDFQFESVCSALTGEKNGGCNRIGYECPANEARETKLPAQAVHQYRDRYGNDIFYEINAYPILNKNGEVSHIVEYALDVTGEERAISKLQASEDRYRNVVERSQDGIVIVQDAQIKFINPAMSAMTGYDAEDVNGMYFDQFFDPDIIEHFSQHYRDRVKGELPKTRFESVLIHKNGKRVFVEVDSDVMKFEMKPAALVFFRDVTHRKENEEKIQQYILELEKSHNIIEDKAKELSKLNKELHRSEDQLLQINAAKDKFFSIIAHDLKSPFNALLSLADILQNEFKSLKEEERSVFLSELTSTAHNTFRLLENLLFWSRSQTGNIKMNREMLDLHHITNETVGVLTESAKLKNIELIKDVPKETLIQADRFMSSTVLRNLISNAIKFTPDGGSIKISITNDEGNFVEVAVSDTGVGIPKEHMSKLFRIDSKFSTEGTKNEKGTGLGLILCKEFVDHHGGTIRVESEEDKGTTFFFTLPKPDSDEVKIFQLH